MVYDDHHSVWEREIQKNNFYMRNYDMQQVEELAAVAGFSIEQKLPMFERLGLFAMEYWEDKGKHRKEKNTVIKLKKKIDKLTGLRLEYWLAGRYIRLENEAKPADRLINLVLKFLKR